MKRTFLAALIYILWLPATAQWKNTTLTMPSPNAAALGIFGEIPVSHFTGVPDISVPLYTLKGNRLTLPVQLSYHTAIRPDMHPGWTGLGWSLFCGGAITRKMNKYPDDFQTVAYGNLGYYFTHNLINNSNWASSTVLSTFTSYELDDGDVEPDEFVFNFNGYFGKFFLDQTGQWQVQCNKKLKVVFNGADFGYPFIHGTSYSGIGSYHVTKSFTKFTIIDERGNKYTFGGSANAIEYSDDMAPRLSHRGENFFANTWYLTKIESADASEVINFNYVRGPFTSYIYMGFNSTYINASHGEPLNPGCSASYSDPGRNGRIISPVYLSSVEMPVQHLRIDFTASKCNDLVYSSSDYVGVMTDVYGGPAQEDYDLLELTSGITFDNPSDATATPEYKRFAWRKLDAMTVVQTSSNTTLRKINFNYIEQSTRRLQLSTLVTKDRDNNTVHTYTFGYDNLLMPDYMTRYSDHWGFNNNSIFPTTIGSADFMTFRTPSESFTKAEVLTSITFPTGSITQFEYEINTYSAYVNDSRTQLVTENGNAGGLRVKRINQLDDWNPHKVTEYYYVKNYTAGSIPSSLTSSGILESKPRYAFTNVSGIDYNGSPFTYQFISSNPVVPLTLNSTGTHIGYSEVVERKSDFSYTIHQFTNHDNGFMDNQPVGTFNRQNSAFIPFSSRDFERGRPLIQRDYNDEGKPVMETISEYARLNESQYSARAISNSLLVVCDNNASRQSYSRSAYYLYYYPFVLSRQTTKEYAGIDGALITGTVEKTFVYNDDRMLKQENLRASNGDFLTTTYKYPPEYPGNTVLINMTNANILDAPVEIASTRNGVAVRWNRINYFSPHTNVYIPQTVETQVAGNAIETERQFYAYDNKGNLLEESLANDVHTVYVWGYNRQVVVAKIRGATNSNVQTAMTAAGITQTQLDDAAAMTDAALRTLLNGLRTQLPNAFVTTYTYAPGMGMTSETDPRNKTLFYEYDAFQRLVVEKDQDGNIIRTYKYNYRQ